MSRVELNDVHSRLNPTAVSGVLAPGSVAEVIDAVRSAAAAGGGVSIGGTRHAMGGQQFRSGAVHLDMTGLCRVLRFDPSRGLVTAEAGITWPALIAELERMQPSTERRWTIRQKQTGADTLTLGGALAANVHGRGLHMRPIIDDVESFTLIDPRGVPVECSRAVNPDLFALAIGGYGMFGVVVDVTLRLAPRTALRRVVRVTDIQSAADTVRERLHEGLEFGDFQFEVDPASPGFLTRGVFACYERVDRGPGAAPGRELRREDWERLLLLAHTDKSQAFERYAAHYLATHDQVYWSDTHQLGVYLDGYHERIDAVCGHRGSEMITEVYVPAQRVAEFLHAAARTLRELRADVIYGTVRLIHKDEESFLAWARDTFACVIFNLHVDHTPAGRDHAARSFRALIDLALERDGNFYLTYHRFATPDQLLRAYPQLPAFIAHKRRVDPGAVFDSDWWRWVLASVERSKATQAE